MKCNTFVKQGYCSFAVNMYVTGQGSIKVKLVLQTNSSYKKSKFLKIN